MFRRRVETFTEFLGEVPTFDTEKERNEYIVEKEQEYLKRHPEGWWYNWFLLGKIFFTERVLNHLPADKQELLGEEQKFAYAKTWALQRYLVDGPLTLAHLAGDKLDFGCGSGGSSVILGNHEGTLHVIDTNRSRLEQLMATYTRLELPDPDKVYFDDGLSHLNNPHHKERYNLIAAFGLGHFDTDQSFVDSFREGVENALKPGGVAVVESDLLTMDKVRTAFGIPCPKRLATMMAYQKKN